MGRSQVSSVLAAEQMAPPVSYFDQAIAQMVPVARLGAERERLREAFGSAKPFPHLVLDGYFDEATLDRVAAEFPDASRRDWSRYDTDHEVKDVSRGIANLSPFTQALMLQLCSEPFLEHIRYITGIKPLVWDPMFHGGGLHESFTGGWLNVHSDWTHHPHLPLLRQLNLIIYLNRDWDEAWGGALDLCDPDTLEVGASVAPHFNRALLFATTKKTLHGFPKPIACPKDRSRKSISVYYWSADPEALKGFSEIRFLPGGGLTRFRSLVRSLLPRIVFDISRGMRRKFGQR